MIAVLVNPRSRANRKNPRIAADFQALIGENGRVFAPKSLDELSETAASLARTPPAVIAVHGGDGTLHKALTALGQAFGETPLPPLAILCGGTMNVEATSLGLRERPDAFLTSLVADVRAGIPLSTLRRRCLRIGDHLGFLFGNGLLANFLGEYYAGDGEYGPARAAWLILRAMGSICIGGPFVRRIFRRFEGTVTVDGTRLERTTFVGVGAGTVREVGLGFKLIHRADEDPERFGVLAMHAGPVALIPDLVAVHAGKGIASRRAFSAVASRLDITSRDGSGMSYTIDGDLYHSASADLSITVGPPVALVKPPRALIVAPRGDTMTATP
jgi:diacylglycerol kinase family enzyme